jgi:hypothetical protein
VLCVAIVPRFAFRTIPSHAGNIHGQGSVAEVARGSVRSAG